MKGGQGGACSEYYEADKQLDSNARHGKISLIRAVISMGVQYRIQQRGNHTESERRPLAPSGGGPPYNLNQPGAHLDALG
jgi:hypothetical protein